MEGYSTDRLIPTGGKTAGGSRLQHGVFAQGNFVVSDFRLFGGVRQDVTGTGTNFVSPNGGITYGRKRFRLRGSVYKSFRTPTLNELYRDFRAGNTSTLSNDLLKPETVFGSEAGFDWIGEKLNVTATAYRNDLGNLITNVTSTSTPALITRQRQNAADAIARGFEMNAKRDFGPIHAQLSYLFADSHVITTRLKIAEVPKHQGSAQLSYIHKGTLILVGMRTASLQFDDDRNTLLLGGYALAQASVRQRLRYGLTASLGIENALDRQYNVALGTVPNIGAPRLVRASLRWER